MRILLAFALSPLPHAGLGFAGVPYDLDGPHALAAQQNDLGATNALPWCVAIPDQRTQALAINHKGYSCSHTPDSHAHARKGIPSRTLMSGENYYHPPN